MFWKKNFSSLIEPPKKYIKFPQNFRNVSQIIFFKIYTVSISEIYEGILAKFGINFGEIKYEKIL